MNISTNQNLIVQSTVPDSSSPVQSSQTPFSPPLPPAAPLPQPEQPPVPPATPPSPSLDQKNQPQTTSIPNTNIVSKSPELKES